MPNCGQNSRRACRGCAGRTGCNGCTGCAGSNGCTGCNGCNGCTGCGGCNNCQDCCRKKFALNAIHQSCVRPRRCYADDLSPEDVIYTGPCPPDPDDCAEESCDCDLESAYLAQTASLTAAAGAALPLRSVERYDESAFRRSQNALALRKSGVYLATFTLHIPAGETVGARLRLMRNERTVDGAANTVNKPASKEPHTETLQAIFSAKAGDRLKIVASEDMCLQAATEDDVVAAFTIVRLR